MPLAAHSLLLDIAVAGTRLVAVGERGHVLVRTAGEGAWQQVNTPTRQMLTSVCFADAKRGWAVGHDGTILASVDGGMNWVLQYLGLDHQARLNREKLDRLRDAKSTMESRFAAEVNYARRSDILRQLDELMLDIEDVELELSEPPFAPPLLDVYCEDQLRVHAVGAFGTVISTRDGGANWTRGDALVDNPGQYHLNSITGSGDGDLWIAGEAGLIFASKDSGEHWFAPESPYHGSFFGVEYQPQTGALLLFGLRGNVFYSRDKGATWTASAVPGGVTLAGGLWLSERFAVLVGAVGAVRVSEDGGYSFKDVSIKKRVNLSAVSVRDGQLLAVGQGGSYTVHIGDGK